MKKFLSLLLLFIFIGCSDDDSSNTEPQTIEGGTVFTSQIVQIELPDLTQDFYQGIINGQSIELGKGNEDTLVFVVTQDIALGEIVLEIPELNNLSIRYTVEQTVLEQTAEDTMQIYIDALDLVSQTITEEEQGDKVLEMITSFNNYYNSLSATDKQSVAEFYYINKDLLQTALDGDFSRLASGTITRFAQCKAGIYLTGILGVTTVLLPATGIGGIFAIVTGVATAVTFAKTVTHCTAVASAKIKSIYLKAQNSILNSRNTLNDDLNFTDSVSKEITMEIGNREIESSDGNDSNLYISTFITMIGDLNDKIILNLNNAITSYNENVPSFFSLDLYEGVTLNETNTVEDFAFTEDIYNATNFTITDENVEIESLNFSDGVINLTLSIINPNIMDGNTINTQLNFTYQNDFNELSGSFDISVTLATAPFTLSGNLDFGDVAVNDAETRTLTITNNAVDEVLAVSLVDLPTGYYANWTSGDIAADASQDITITFIPTMVQDYSGIVTINNNIDQENNTIPITGNGTPEVGVIALSGDLDFGNVVINTAATRSLFITNESSFPINVTSLNLPTGYTSIWSGGSIAEGNVQNVVITFEPTQVQDYQGTIIVNNDVDQVNNTIAVTGSGVENNYEELIIGTWLLTGSTENGVNSFDPDECDIVEIYNGNQLDSTSYYDSTPETEDNDCLAADNIVSSYTIENGNFLYDSFEGDTDISEILLLNDTTLVLEYVEEGFTSVETYTRQ